MKGNKPIMSCIDAWFGEEEHKEQTCRTDGRIIWSYELPIAERTKGNTYRVLDPAFALKPNGDPSVTTKQHIAMVRKALAVGLVVIVDSIEI